jgi:hypothetical protein
MPEQLELQQLVETGSSRLDDVERGGGGGTAVVVSRCRPCPYLGLLLATLSSLFFSLCSVIVKWLVDVHPMELAACRFMGVLLPALPIVLWRREQPFPRGRRIMLLLRSFVGTTGLMLSFYAFRHMPLADASVNLFIFVNLGSIPFQNSLCRFRCLLKIVNWVGFDENTLRKLV